MLPFLLGVGISAVSIVASRWLMRWALRRASVETSWLILLPTAARTTMILTGAVVVQMTTDVDLIAFVGWLIASFLVMLSIETVVVIRTESKTNSRKNSPPA